MQRISLCLLVLAACGGDDGGGGGGDDGPMMTVDARPSSDAPAQTFPATCQRLPLICPDKASLDMCEANDAHAFGLCDWIPITAGCASSGCPSDAQICRTAETAAGYCTHSCVDNDDCPIAGGGTASCETVSGVVEICIKN